MPVKSGANHIPLSRDGVRGWVYPPEIMKNVATYDYRDELYVTDFVEKQRLS